VHDSVRLDLVKNEVVGVCKFQQGAVCMMTGGNNIGRVGTMVHREKHPGSFEIVHLKDSEGHQFATRIGNVMVIGNERAFVSLPKGNGIKLSNIDDRKRIMGA